MRANAVRRGTAFAKGGAERRSEMCTSKGACLVTTRLSMPSPHGWLVRDEGEAEVAQANCVATASRSRWWTHSEGGAVPVEREDGLVFQVRAGEPRDAAAVLVESAPELDVEPPETEPYALSSALARSPN